MGDIHNLDELIEGENRLKNIASEVRGVMGLVVRMGVELTEEDKQKHFCSKVKKLLPKKYTRDGLSFLSYGKSGCPLFRSGELVIKLVDSEESKEFEYLKRVSSANQFGLTNVVGLGDFSGDFGVIGLEYVKGKLLEDLIRQLQLPISTVWSYGRGICNGILELRRAGLYHRDIHGKNILISSEDKLLFDEHTIIERFYNSPVILDLGAATDNPKDIHNENRTYGGNNDLVSLGQLMYRMVMGRNLFKEGSGLTTHEQVMNDVKVTREEVYSSWWKKRKVLNKAKRRMIKKTGDGRLVRLIHSLLDDKLFVQPGIERVDEMLRRFDRYCPPIFHSKPPRVVENEFYKNFMDPEIGEDAGSVKILVKLKMVLEDYRLTSTEDFDSQGKTIVGSESEEKQLEEALSEIPDEGIIKADFKSYVMIDPNILGPKETRLLLKAGWLQKTNPMHHSSDIAWTIYKKKTPLKPSEITHVIFDVDGTLYDKKREYIKGKGTVEDTHNFLRYKAFSELETGRLSRKKVAQKVVADYHDAIEEGSLDDEISFLTKSDFFSTSDLVERYEELLKLYGSNGRLFALQFGAPNDYFAHILSNAGLESVLGIDRLLLHTIEQLKDKGYKLGILTNEVESTVRKVLDALGLEYEDFELHTGTQNHIFCRETGVDKPSSKAFEELVRLNGGKHQNYVYVGDSLSKDVQPALKVGMQAVHITSSEIICLHDGYVETNIYALDKIL